MTKRFAIDIKKRNEVFEKTDGRCFYCGIKLENENLLDWGGKVVSTIHHWHIDHMIPLSRGGDNNINNLVPACLGCNRMKGTMTAEEYLLKVKS